MRDYGITPAPNNPSGVQNLFEQQSTMRDAMVTALNLNIFNNNAEKIKMANVAQLVNNLHCLFLAGGEHCITTPTYHIFDMMKWHQGGLQAPPRNSRRAYAAHCLNSGNGRKNMHDISRN